MPALSFSVLKDKLERREKCQTIRKPRKKNPIKYGDHLYLWWRQRSPGRKKLGEGVVTGIQRKKLYCITEEEAQRDGFEGGEHLGDFTAWGRLYHELMRMHPGIDIYSEFDVITWRWL